MGNPFILKYLGHPPDQPFVIVIWYESMGEGNSKGIKQLIHIVGYNFRIGGYYRAVIVVLRFGVFHIFVVYTWIEYPFFTHFYKSPDMPVYHLGRITGRIR